MKWSLNELQKYRNEPLVFSETVDLKKTLMNREKELMDVSPIDLEGTLIVHEKEILLHMVVSLTVTLPSARSLKPVLFPMSIGIDEIYIPPSATPGSKIDNEEETVILLDKDMIDLTEAITDAVLLNLPLQVFTQEEIEGQEMPSGNDWLVVSEDEYISDLETQKSETEDPRFAGLKDLFKDESDNQK